MSDSINHAVCWAEIPVLNLEKGRVFYGAIFKKELEITNPGGGEIVFLPMEKYEEVSGHLYVGKPSTDGTGPTVHLVVPDNLETASARAKDAGATLVGEIVSIQPGRFQYIQDPCGNSIGLFEVAS